jgi:hypothetical protein
MAERHYTVRMVERETGRIRKGCLQIVHAVLMFAEVAGLAG